MMAPAAFLIGLWLLAARRHYLLWWWCVLLTLALTLVALTKIAFLGWGFGIPALNFTGISGHSTFAMAVLPVMVFLLLYRYPAPLRAIGVGAALALGVLVGMSRLALSLHSHAEVVAGCVLGALVSLGFIWVASSTHRARLNRTLVALSLGVLFAASFAQAAPTQNWFIRVALYLSGHEQPFVRSHATRVATNPPLPARPALFRFPAATDTKTHEKLPVDY